MAEQVVLIRHGFSTGNKRHETDGGYVQGPRAGLHERGFVQIEWSAMQLARLVMTGKIEKPTHIYTADMKRLEESAGVIGNKLQDLAGLSLPVTIVRELEEKREPALLEDKTGDEIHADPALKAIAEAIRKRHLDAEYRGSDGIDAGGFETWPQAFSRVSLFLRTILSQEGNPILVSSNGPMSIARAQLEHNMNLLLTETESPEPDSVTYQQMFDQYLFKFGNAEGMVYQKDKEGSWVMAHNWTRPESL